MQPLQAGDMMVRCYCRTKVKKCICWRKHRMQKAMELKEMIEQERKMLDKVVAECGVDHEDAYVQSKKMDDLIVRYYEA